MAPLSRRGVFWQDEEVEAMLAFLLRAGLGARVMRSTHLENLSLFRRVAAHLAQRGFQRSAEQCRARFKRAKGLFFQALETWGDCPPTRCRPLFFEELRRLWEQGGRPRWEERRHAATRRNRMSSPEGGQAPLELVAKEEAEEEAIMVHGRKEEALDTAPLHAQAAEGQHGSSPESSTRDANPPSTSTASSGEEQAEPARETADTSSSVGSMEENPMSFEEVAACLHSIERRVMETLSSMEVRLARTERALARQRQELQALRQEVWFCK